jgi:SAM-dependent methyltransferase
MLYQDSNEIWTSDNEGKKVFYPDRDYNLVFEIEDKSYWFKHRNEVIKTIMLKYSFSKNFADIGGGNGFQVKYLQESLPSKNIFLIEPSLSGCLNAKKRGVKNIYSMFFQEFPFEKLEVNAVGLFDVIEHIEDDTAFLKEISNKLESGSLFFITVPAYKWLWSDMDVYSEHFRRYDSNKIKELAKSANLEIIHNGKFFFYLPIITLLFRVLPDLFSSRKKDLDENFLKEELKKHKANFITEFIFKPLNKLEIAFLKKIKIIFGASCIVVLRKP